MADEGGNVAVELPQVGDSGTGRGNLRHDVPQGFLVRRVERLVGSQIGIPASKSFVNV